MEVNSESSIHWISNNPAQFLQFLPSKVTLCYEREVARMSETFFKVAVQASTTVNNFVSV